MSSSSTADLTVDRAEALIRQLTDGLVNIKDSAGEFAYDMPGGGKLDTKSWDQWEWTHGVALTALYNVSCASEEIRAGMVARWSVKTASPKPSTRLCAAGIYHEAWADIQHAAVAPSPDAAAYSLKAALDWFETQYRKTDGKGVSKNINTMAPFYCLASFIADGKITDAKYKGWVEEWAGWIMEDGGLPKTEERGFQHITYLEVNKNQLWDDTLMMTVIPLTKIGLLLNRPDYIEEAKYQFLLHVTYLLDAPSGLWYHGWEFTPGQPLVGHNFARALWARGNCWVTVAIPLFLEILGDKLPKDDPIRRMLVSVLGRQVESLVKLQDAKTGLWHTLLIDPSSYLESSATAGFAVGIFAATRLGLLPPNPAYLDCANRALRGVLACIGEDGELSQTSFGTGMGHNLQFYHDIPITPMPYGQALAMLALVEWERLHRAQAS